MSLASLAIKRPTFLTCAILMMLVIGYLSLRKLPIDLFPDISLPVVTVTTPYPGAAPQEIEVQVSKVLEDEISNIAGIKSLKSINREGVSIVVVEFNMSTDIKYAEQQVRDRVSTAKRKLPLDIKEPTIRRISPSDQPVMVISLRADLTNSELFDLADQEIRPKLEQVFQVGLVSVSGGRKREIHISLDQDKLQKRKLSATLVGQRLAAAGENIPVGKYNENDTEQVFRTLGEFKSLDDIKKTIINFWGNDVPVTIEDVAKVEEGLVDETTRAYHDGEKTLTLLVYRQAGANTIAVSHAVSKVIDSFNKDLARQKGKPKLQIVRTTAKMIEDNVTDVRESIFIGIFLTILVVLLFLGNVRSTIITGLALPNSLMGAFILMTVAGFTINVMTLLALSLAVGLLVDDAIVVRENIFRHRGMGKSAEQAALDGTHEVTLAVIATTFTVLAVFGPIGFLQGVVGQFFKEFGLTICFAMLISLFDALTIAPMMSAYFGGKGHGAPQGFFGKTVTFLLLPFEKMQLMFEWIYGKILRFVVRFPLLILAGAAGIFFGSLYLMKFVPKTFLSPQDTGEFMVSLDMAPGTNLDRMDRVAKEIDQVIRAQKEVKSTLLTVGSVDSGANIAEFFVTLVPRKERPMNTSQFKEILRGKLRPYTYANPLVKDLDMVAGGLRPFNVNIIGDDLAEVERLARAALAKLKNHPALKDVDISSRSGKPEVQFVIDKKRSQELGVSPNIVGMELRTLVEGIVPAVFRENGKDYDIRVRLKDSQRNLAERFDKTYVPNINNSIVKLKDVAQKVDTEGPANINRQDRGRYIQISADISATGPGMAQAMSDITKMFTEGELKLPENYKYKFVGQAESFGELVENMVIAILLSVIFIYFVLASLYESFVTPLTIMLVLPLAICGALIALFVMGKSLDMNSMIGCILLLGIATKNSILIVDYANQLVQGGMHQKEAVIKAGITRLRPILMTTLALIAGMLPIAIGLNEASNQRTSMGIAVIGGLISSTMLSLLVVPASYTYIERFRLWSKRLASKLL